MGDLIQRFGIPVLVALAVAFGAQIGAQIGAKTVLADPVAIATTPATLVFLYQILASGICYLLFPPLAFWFTITKMG